MSFFSHIKKKLRDFLINDIIFDKNELILGLKYLTLTICI